MDSGRQNHLLAKAMREHLGWDAKNIIVKESYLKFDTDWTVEKNAAEANEFAKTADLFIFQDLLMKIPELDLVELCGHRNTIVCGMGTPMRNRIQATLMDQMDGWAVVPPISDETIASKLFPAPFENVIVPIEEINAITKGIKRNEVVTVCHAPTKSVLKGTDLVESILRPLDEEGVIKYLPIKGMAWNEALRAKATAHITIDSLGKEFEGEPKFPAAYGAGNALEGLVLGHIVIGRVSPWCYALHPDLPIVSTWGREEKTGEIIRENIEFGAKSLMKNEELYTAFKERQIGWVKTHFSAENQVQKWKHYIDWVMHR
jgi:hypothetical protein